MNSIVSALLFLTSLAQGGAAAPAPSATEATIAAQAFAKIKKLAGTWEARAPKTYGNSVIRLQYRLMSDDSVVVETFKIDDQALEMLTVYHLDGDELTLTHFCAVNNQVRMRADLKAPGSPAGSVRTIAFNFKDGSNLGISHHQVMDRLTLAFESETRLTQTWHWRDHKTPTGEDTAVYRYTRVR